MDGVARTAYYCLGVRAADARAAKPICGDTYAARFMDAEAETVFALFKDEAAPNASNAVRARIFDDWLRERLAADPATRVILLGAGFDTRAFRLSGGDWVELDHPALMALKEQKLPAHEAKNPLTRSGIDFAVDSLAEKLEPWRGGRPTIVVMEGVTAYLSIAQFTQTLMVLQDAFPRHTLMCDLTTATFASRYSGPIREKIASLGATFAPPSEDPARDVIACGYRQAARLSIIGQAAKLGAVRIPGFMLNLFLRPLRDGYCAYQFETVG